MDEVARWHGNRWPILPLDGTTGDCSSLLLVSLFFAGSGAQGNFYNRDYDVSGTITVAVDGNSQVVRLSSESGSATFEMRR